MLRNLVTIRTIASLSPIPNADAIEVATVDGWKVVTKKGEFSVGDPCVYFEIDSFLPESDARYAFLMKSSVREFEGKKGHKLRTVKLRGQISQGLVLPLSLFPELEDYALETLHGVDLSEKLGIKKYEAPIPASLAGQVKGGFPSFITKTDQERCQNLLEEIFVQNKDARYEVTTKLDGASATFYHLNTDGDERVGVCSRNLELKINDENKDNSFVRVFLDSNLEIALRQVGNVAIQGELMGPGIQGNREGLKKHTLFIFDAQNLDTGEFLGSDERLALVEKLYDLGVNPALVQHVPVLQNDTTLGDLGIDNVADLLSYAEGTSLNHAVREGVVFKRLDGDFSFKAISNRFLAKAKD